MCDGQRLLEAHESLQVFRGDNLMKYGRGSIPFSSLYREGRTVKHNEKVVSEFV